MTTGTERTLSDPKTCPDCDEHSISKPDGVWQCHNCGWSEEDSREPPEPDGECYRGSEYASALAEEQARIQRELK